MTLHVVNGVPAKEVIVEYVPPAAYGPNMAHGYFEVWYAGFPCGHRHFKSAGARGCKQRLERWLKSSPPE